MSEDILLVGIVLILLIIMLICIGSWIYFSKKHGIKTFLKAFVISVFIVVLIGKILDGAGKTFITPLIDNYFIDIKSTEEYSNVEGLENNKVIKIEPCDLNGKRKANVKVDIGFDSDYVNREYWGYTNDYGQLVYVEAQEIILQDDEEEEEEEKGDNRYCSDEAKVYGVESSNLDEGHAIADSLGGVSNAYNITPQNSYQNRYGDQADLEQQIRDYENAGIDVTNFKYNITYENSKTQTPYSYSGSYDVGGETQEFKFENE